MCAAASESVFNGDFDEALIGKRVGGEDQLELRELLGRGGMGAVYGAWNLQKQRECAVKFLLPNRVDRIMRRRFLKEARKLAGIRHPVLMRVFALGKWNECLYIESEWIRGRNLYDLVRESGALTCGEALRVVGALAHGLAAAHDAEIIHRDLKPENVMLRDGDRAVKLIDFGIAKDMNASMVLTQHGEFLGTPGYTAPEQSESASDVDGRADIFSLGIILYELLTGNLAFDGRDTRAVLKASRKGARALKDRLDREVTGPLAKLIEEMTQPKPKGRPQDMREVARRVEEIAAELSPEDAAGAEGVGGRVRALFEGEGP